MRCLWAPILLALTALPLLAEAPATTPRPLPRPAAATAMASANAAVTAPAPAAMPRPRARPTGLTVPPPQPEALIPLDTLIASVRPRPRPADLAPPPEVDLAAAAPADKTPRTKQKKPRREKASKAGSVCGDPQIKGEKLARITSKVKGCGVEDPVRVTSVSGIRLSQPATITCDTAQALRQWVDGAMRPAFGKREVVELRIAAHYICRPRNNKKGNKISEHGRGKALDIGGFVFSDGTEWSIARDYNAQIRKAHKGACGIFGTTLGPGSDGYHEDHLHFDTARYNNGTYCR